MARHRHARAPWELKNIPIILNRFNSLTILRNRCGEALLQGSLGATKLGTYIYRASGIRMTRNESMRAGYLSPIYRCIVYSAPVYGIPQGALENIVLVGETLHGGRSVDIRC